MFIESKQKKFRVILIIAAVIVTTILSILVILYINSPIHNFNSNKDKYLEIVNEVKRYPNLTKFCKFDELIDINNFTINNNESESQYTYLKDGKGYVSISSKDKQKFWEMVHDDTGLNEEKTFDLSNKIQNLNIKCVKIIESDVILIVHSGFITGSEGVGQVYTQTGVLSQKTKDSAQRIVKIDNNWYEYEEK